ncbi:MAG: hypothetical protein AB7G37_01070 [Solirubrobacteraceae bacterium]
MSTTTVSDTTDDDRPRATSIPIVSEAEKHAWDEEYVRPTTQTLDDGQVIVAGGVDLPAGALNLADVLHVEWLYTAGGREEVILKPPFQHGQVSLYLGGRLAVAAALDRLAAQLRYDPPEASRAAR